jgi:hypothetical protein
MARSIEIPLPYPSVTVFYGHIHQEHHFSTGHVAHHSARSLIFPLPAPGSQPRRTPLRWDPAQHAHGLGFREIDARVAAASLVPREFALADA